MGVRVRSGETTKCEASFHWSSYLIPGIWAGIFSFGVLGAILGGDRSLGQVVFTCAFAYLPITYRVLQNWCKSYVLTDQRLYVEEGVITKSKRDLPLEKINDVEVSQNIIQRLFGAAHVVVFTGNDKPTVMKNISHPDEFKEAISSSAKAYSKAVA